MGKEKVREVDLSNLPRWGKNGKAKEGSINWANSINCTVPFVYDDIKGIIKIVGYFPKNNNIIVEYLDSKTQIFASSLVGARLFNLIGKRSSNFKFKIEERFKDDKRDMVITDREYRKRTTKTGVINDKYYRYCCNVCGWTEGWIVEGDLNRGNGCSCCSGKVVVEDINSMWKTNPWMIGLGVGEEYAKVHTHCSHDTIEVTCPHCGDKFKTKCYNVFMNKSISCKKCGDGFSYPEKFIYSVLKQLGVEFETQLSKTTFEWCGNYRYDFYIPSFNMIIEAHGIQHYKENNRGRSLKEEQDNDRLKKELALSNGIKNYIELDCRYSELDYIKSNILKSDLSNNISLNSIDWNECESFIFNNQTKEICEYWCHRKENETVSHLSKIFNIGNNSIRECLKKGDKLGWCEYDPKEELRLLGKRMGALTKNRNSIPVRMIKDGVELGVFESSVDLAKNSEELFGVKLDANKIRMVCNKKRKHHRHFVFEYIPMKEYEKYKNSQELSKVV